MLQACFKKEKKLYDSGYSIDKSNQLFYFNQMINKIWNNSKKDENLKKNNHDNLKNKHFSREEKQYSLIYSQLNVKG
jgi:hypothetical protein